MTRKESDALLKEMRETGLVALTIGSANVKIVSKVRGKFIRFSGFGSWACKNTLADFYDEMKYRKLIKKLPSYHCEWGL